MKKKEYLTFVPSLSELVEGKELLLAIRDLTPGPQKYDCRYVKALVSPSARRLPGGDILRVRSWTGVLYPIPWAIKITQEAGEYIPGRPHGETLGID